MINLRHILVPTDFSEHSRHALQYGIALAEKFNAELHLLNVFQDLSVYQADAVMVPVLPSAATLTANARAALDKLIEENNLAHLVVHTEVREGSPIEEIVAYAHDQNIDLIVIATHGRGWLAHLLLGSVAEKVVRKAPCPVMAIHLAEHEFIELAGTSLFSGLVCGTALLSRPIKKRLRRAVSTLFVLRHLPLTGQTRMPKPLRSMSSALSGSSRLPRSTLTRKKAHNPAGSPVWS